MEQDKRIDQLDNKINMLEHDYEQEKIYSKNADNETCEYMEKYEIAMKKLEMYEDGDDNENKTFAEKGLVEMSKNLMKSRVSEEQDKKNGDIAESRRIERELEKRRRMDKLKDKYERTVLKTNNIHSNNI